MRAVPSAVSIPAQRGPTVAAAGVPPVAAGPDPSVGPIRPPARRSADSVVRL
jgi:hypothetical protein